MEPCLDNSNNPCANSNGSDIVGQKGVLVLDLADGFNQNGSNETSPANADVYQSPDLYNFLERPSNGKRSADAFEDEEDDDFGPETDVDAIDDVLLSPTMMTSSIVSGSALHTDNNNPLFDKDVTFLPNPFAKESVATLVDDLELQRKQSSEFDPAREAREETPTPPADEVLDANSSVLENVAESGEESEDEWNYFKGDQSEHKENLILPESQDNDLIESDLDHDAMSQLNPDAAEFVPVSPTRSNASPVSRALLNDIIAQSPNRAPQEDMDINLPTHLDFEKEVRCRPNDVEYTNGHDKNGIDEASQEIMLENFLNTKNEVEPEKQTNPFVDEKLDEVHELPEDIEDFLKEDSGPIVTDDFLGVSELPADVHSPSPVIDLCPVQVEEQPLSQEMQHLILEDSIQHVEDSETLKEVEVERTVSEAPFGVDLLQEEVVTRPAECFNFAQTSMDAIEISKSPQPSDNLLIPEEVGDVVTQQSTECVTTEPQLLEVIEICKSPQPSADLLSPEGEDVTTQPIESVNVGQGLMEEAIEVCKSPQLEAPCLSPEEKLPIPELPKDEPFCPLVQEDNKICNGVEDLLVINSSPVAEQPSFEAPIQPEIIAESAVIETTEDNKTELPVVSNAPLETSTALLPEDVSVIPQVGVTPATKSIVVEKEPVKPTATTKTKVGLSSTKTKPSVAPKATTKPRLPLTSSARPPSTGKPIDAASTVKKTVGSTLSSRTATGAPKIAPSNKTASGVAASRPRTLITAAPSKTTLRLPAKTSVAARNGVNGVQKSPRTAPLSGPATTRSPITKTTSSTVTASRVTSATSRANPKVPATTVAPKPAPITRPTARPLPITKAKTADSEKQLKETVNKQLSATRTTRITTTNSIRKSTETKSPITTSKTLNVTAGPRKPTSIKGTVKTVKTEVLPEEKVHS